MSRPDTRAEVSRRQRANLKLGLVLASVALVFGLGFMAKIIWFGR